MFSGPQVAETLLCISEDKHLFHCLKPEALCTSSLLKEETLTNSQNWPYVDSSFVKGL